MFCCNLDINETEVKKKKRMKGLIFILELHGRFPKKYAALIFAKKIQL